MLRNAGHYVHMEDVKPEVKKEEKRREEKVITQKPSPIYNSNQMTTSLQGLITSYAMNNNLTTDALPEDYIPQRGTINPSQLDIEIEPKENCQYSKKALDFCCIPLEDDNCCEAIVKAPLSCVALPFTLFADGVACVKNKIQERRNNEDLENIFGPSIQRMS